MKRTLTLLAVMLLMLSLACSALSFNRGEEPADPGSSDVPPAAVEEPAAVEDQDIDTGEEDAEQPPSDDEESASEDEPDSSSEEELTYDTGGLEELDSYRATMTYEVTKADGSVETFSIEQAATRNPLAQRFLMSSTDGDMEYIQIEEQMWIRFGEEWIQSSSDEMSDSDFGSFLSTSDDWISEIDNQDYEYLGKENINGLATKHYRVSYSAGWLALLDETNTDGDIESGVADVWIANEPDLPEFLVRYRVELEGTIDGEEGDATLSQDVTEVNQPIEIEAPEGVAMGGLPDDVPLYPGATEVTSFGTMTTFAAPDDLDTVNEFYDGALAAAGWEKGPDSMQIEGMASSTWTKGSDQLTLTITTDDNGLVTVLIMMGE